MDDVHPLCHHDDHLLRLHESDLGRHRGTGDRSTRKRSAAKDAEEGRRAGGQHGRNGLAVRQYGYGWERPPVAGGNVGSLRSQPRVQELDATDGHPPL